MAIQSFYKQRRPRGFEHKPIYWDPRKEELNKRVERIKRELIANGEIEGELEEATTETQDELPLATHSEAREERIRGAFRHGTEHLMRQHQRGIDSEERAKRMIKLMLVLLGLGFVLWYFLR